MWIEPTVRTGEPVWNATAVQLVRINQAIKTPARIESIYRAELVLKNTEWKLVVRGPLGGRLYTDTECKIF